MVHHGTGESHAAQQLRFTKHTAPLLRAWLHGFEPDARLEVDFGGALWTGDDLVPLNDMQRAALEYGRWEQVFVEPEPLSLDLDETTPCIPERTLVTYTRRVYKETHRVGFRDLVATLRVFEQNGAKADARRFKRAVVEFAMNMMRATHGIQTSKVIARQTSYRPVQS